MQSRESLHVLTLTHVSDVEKQRSRGLQTHFSSHHWRFPGGDLVERAPQWCCRKSPNSPHISSLLPAIKYPSENREKLGRGEMSHCSPAKKGAQSLRKRTTALVSKLRLRETHFNSEYHITDLWRGSIQNSFHTMK